MIKHTVLALLSLSAMSFAQDAPGVTSNSILLGQSCALKGPAAGLGLGMSLGLNTYFDQLNSRGGINGRNVVLKSINDSYEPELTIVVTKALIEKINVFALIGEVGTPTSKVAVPIAEEHQVPFLAPFTGAEFLRNPNKNWVINFRASYYQEMEQHAKYLVDTLGLERIACFYQNDGYGQAGLAGIEQALERRGMRLVSTGTYERNTLAIKTGLDAVAPGKPQAVLMVGAYQPCAAFIRSAKRDPNTKDAIFGNLSFVGTKNLLAELGDSSEGCIVTQVVPYPWDSSLPVVKEYQTAMKAAGIESEIGFITLEGYLAAKLFDMALSKMSGTITRQGFIDTVTSAGSFDLGGITLTYGVDDHQGMDQVYMTIFQGGKIKSLQLSAESVANR